MTFSCPICVKAVLDSDDGVGCEASCQRWFHRECIGMSKPEYQRISGNNKIKWYCSRTDCLPPSNQPRDLLLNQLSILTDKITELTNKVDSLTSLPAKVDSLIVEVDTLNTNVLHLERRVNDNECRVKALEERVISASQQGSSTEQIVSELSDRSRRSKNIMLYDLNESLDGNVETRKRHDSNLVQKLLANYLSGANLDGIKILRVGKKIPNKTRPLKVIMDSEASVGKFLSNFSPESAKQIDNCFSKVRVSRDRTPREMEFFKSLKLELERRISQGEKDLTIKYKNNVPCIVKNQKNA